jgi:type I restriction enzyme S subunit
MNWNNYYVTIKEIENWNLNFTENTDRLDDESLNMINKYCKLENWNILLSRIWSVWKTYLIKNYMNNYNISETIYCLKIINKELLPKYLNYFLNIDSTQKYLKWNLRAWLLKSLKRETVKNINLILYDIETTNWLLKIFDLFYKLSQDINNWINLEIKLLNKQYKYYLNKLLTF